MKAMIFGKLNRLVERVLQGAALVAALSFSPSLYALEIDTEAYEKSIAPYYESFGEGGSTELVFDSSAAIENQEPSSTVSEKSSDKFITADAGKNIYSDSELKQSQINGSWFATGGEVNNNIYRNECRSEKFVSFRADAAATRGIDRIYLNHPEGLVRAVFVTTNASAFGAGDRQVAGFMNSGRMGAGDLSAASCLVSKNPDLHSCHDSAARDSSNGGLAVAGHSGFYTASLSERRVSCIADAASVVSMQGRDCSVLPQARAGLMDHNRHNMPAGMPIRDSSAGIAGIIAPLDLFSPVVLTRQYPPS